MADTDIKEDRKNKDEMAAQDIAAPAPAEQTGVEENVELNKLKEEIENSKDKYLRLYSEFENFRRRTAKEKLEMVQTANEQLIKDLLPIADDFDRAEKSMKEKNDKDGEGFNLIKSKLKKVLELYGVKSMDVKIGSDFDTELHEAITQMPAPEEKLKGKVVEVVESGYLLNEKVIRFAKVVVGS